MTQLFSEAELDDCLLAHDVVGEIGVVVEELVVVVDHRQITLFGGKEKKGCDEMVVVRVVAVGGAAPYLHHSH